MTHFLKKLKNRNIEQSIGIIKDKRKTRSNENNTFLENEKKQCKYKIVQNIKDISYMIFCNKDLKELEYINHYTYVLLLDFRNNDIDNNNNVILQDNNCIEGLIIYIGESKKRKETIIINNELNNNSRIYDHLNINNTKNYYLKNFIKLNTLYKYTNNIYLKIIVEESNSTCINEFNEFIRYFKYFPRNTYGSIISKNYYIDNKKEYILDELIKKQKTGIEIYNYIKKNKHKFKTDWTSNFDWTINRILNEIYNSVNSLKYEVNNFK